MFIKTYQIHLIKIFISLLTKVTMVFLSLIIILNIFEEITFFKDLNADFYFPVLLTFLNTPSVVYDLFPFIFLITTQFFFINLLDKDELNLLKSYGLNNIKLIKLLSILSFSMGIIIVIIFYNFSSNLKFFYLNLKNQSTIDNKYLAVITENGIWIRDEINEEINIINAEKININKLKDVDITQFNYNFDYIRTIKSPEIDISKNIWIINDAKVFNKNIKAESLKILEFKSNFTSEKINNLFSNLSSLSILELYELRKDYESLGYSSQDINFHLQKIYSYPLLLMLLTVLSSIIMLNIKNNQPRVINIILGILISVIVYYLNYFFSVLGKNGNLPLLASNWIPIIMIMIVVSIGLVRINDK